MRKVLYCLFIFSLIGCASKPGVKLLQEDAKKFHQSLRWSSLEGAVVFMSPEHKQTLVPHYAKWIDETKIVDFTILGTQFSEKEKKANLWVEYSYYEIVHETLKKKREKQTWETRSGSRNWQIVSVED